jgi:hypothetical protein
MGIWKAYESGKWIGQAGEWGVITVDEEYSDGARITLERDELESRSAIDCGVYGWFFHTSLSVAHDVAQDQFAQMKVDLAAIVDDIPADADFDDRSDHAIEVINGFVSRYP